jgi:threonine/homoserine/homoserine lactone efflux protein
MEFFALVLFVLSTSGTPGPNNIMILTSGVNHGAVKSIPHILGVNLGFPFMILALGFGAMELFKTLPSLYLIIKVAGVLYLAYLAFKIATMPVVLTGKNTAKPFSFMQAALFQWVNPKAWVMGVSAIVAFSSPESEVLTQVAIIAGAFLMFGLPCSIAWLVVGVSLKKLLSNQRYLRRFNVVMALILLFSLFPMVVSIFEASTVAII